MNTKELFGLIRIKERMCNSTGGCQNCPLHFATCRFDYCDDFDDLDRLIRTVKEWDAAHPVLEEVGDNIYFDPKHRIVPDEVMRVFTIEVTYADKGDCVWSGEKIKKWREIVVPTLIDGAFPNADDVKCVKVQQFVTKAHEEGEEDNEWRE